MAEWQTYELADFLMFAPEIYYRLIEGYNLAVWPWHFVVIMLFAAVVMMLFRGMIRPIFLLLAILWISVAWAFFDERFSMIMLFAPHMAAAFVVQAILLVVAISRPGCISMKGGGKISCYGGFLLMAMALVGPVLISHLSGRGWSGVETIGLMPDPTVTATFGVLLLAVRSPWWLYVVPALWSIFSGLMLYVMEAPVFWLLPLIAIMTVTLKGLIKLRVIWRG